jgi:L-amino acid N-acyltransferase
VVRAARAVAPGDGGGGGRPGRRVGVAVALVENSVYLRPDHQRRGLGTLLLRDLVARATAAGHHTILAGVDAEQPASIALHAKLGFVRVALLKEVGYKFGRWRDVIYMQLVL